MKVYAWLVFASVRKGCLAVVVVGGHHAAGKYLYLRQALAHLRNENR
jgi:hypothetical protein